jgi:hypothetical protein
MPPDVVSVPADPLSQIWLRQVDQPVLTPRSPFSIARAFGAYAGIAFWRARRLHRRDSSDTLPRVRWKPQRAHGESRVLRFSALRGRSTTS